MADPTTPSHHAVKPRGVMESTIGDVLTCIVPTIILFVVGLIVGAGYDHPLDGATLLPIPWITIMLVLGLKFPAQQEFLVVERFNKFHSIKFGFDLFNFINPLLDRVRYHGTFKGQDFVLYAYKNTTSEEREYATIDFTDASAPIEATGWYTIGSPSDVAAKNREVLATEIALYVYSLEDPIKRVRKIFDAALRPRLQSLSIDEVSINGDSVVEDAAKEACTDLATLGVYPLKTQSIVIDDVELPQAVIDIREEKLKGEKQAAEVAASMGGPVGAIRAIQALSGDGAMTYQEATEIFLRNKALDTIAGKSGDLTLVGRDMEGVLLSVNAGKKGS